MIPTNPYATLEYSFFSGAVAIVTAGILYGTPPDAPMPIWPVVTLTIAFWFSVVAWLVPWTYDDEGYPLAYASCSGIPLLLVSFSVHEAVAYTLLSGICLWVGGIYLLMGISISLFHFLHRTFHRPES